MSKRVGVTGLPIDLKFMKLIVFLRHTFTSTDVTGKFWITELSDDEDAPAKKKMLVDFESTHDALQAVEALDNAYFRDGQHGKHLLRAHLCDGISDTSDYQQEQNQMEMDLFRAQSLVIEEEKRLLLEKKKLEIMKQNGGYSVPHGGVGKGVDQRLRAPLHHPLVLNPKRIMINSKEQPLPCKILMGQLRRHVAQMAIKKEKSMLGRLVRSTLRERLSVLLTKKYYKSTQEIVDLYREHYPISKDVEFIQELIIKLKNSFFPRLSHNKAYKKAIKNAKDIVDEVKSEAGESSHSGMQVDLQDFQNEEQMSANVDDTDNEMKEYSVELKSSSDTERVNVKTE